MMVYSQGYYIAASPETPYLQIGESRYGKPAVDRIGRGMAAASRAPIMGPGGIAFRILPARTDRLQSRRGAANGRQTRPLPSQHPALQLPGCAKAIELQQSHRANAAMGRAANGDDRALRIEPKRRQTRLELGDRHIHCTFNTPLLPLTLGPHIQQEWRLGAAQRGLQCRRRQLWYFTEGHPPKVPFKPITHPDYPVRLFSTGRRAVRTRAGSHRRKTRGGSRAKDWRSRPVQPATGADLTIDGCKSNRSRPAALGGGNPR